LPLECMNVMWSDLGDDTIADAVFRYLQGEFAGARAKRGRHDYARGYANGWAVGRCA
jgi:hypothetical protein